MKVQQVLLALAAIIACTMAASHVMACTYVYAKNTTCAGNTALTPVCITKTADITCDTLMKAYGVSAKALGAVKAEADFKYNTCFMGTNFDYKWSACGSASTVVIGAAVSVVAVFAF